MSRYHSRNASEETNATTESSYNMVLEHVLQYPGSYEIPLRTMYTLNCTPRAQPLPKDLSRAPSPSANSSNNTPASAQLAWTDAETATMNFTSQLMNHIGSLGAQSGSLPPAFIVSFVSRCFHPSLGLVDWPQALTALDYLRDLEKRRCKDYIAAFERLGIQINHDTFDASVASVAEKYPGIALWAKNMHGKNQKAEQYYAVLYQQLRRWIMINELSMQPFNKLNCMGMLNTLLPPQSPSGASRLPTPLLDAEVLKEERNTFFEYIQLVQKRGPSILQDLVALNKQPGDETGWDRVQKLIDKYLRVAKMMIDDCNSTTGTEKFNAVDESRKGKKTDSGVSFGSERRPSTGTNSLGDKPLPSMPSEASSLRGLSKIERITREFKRMRVKSKPDITEIIQVDRQAAAERLPVVDDNKGRKSLKKSRSFASLAHAKQSNSSSTSLVGSRKASDAMPFDAEEMKRHRAMYEASTMKKN